MTFEAFEALPDGVRLRLRVQPRASRSEIVGLAGGRLKVRLTAPPLEGAANDACRDLIADWLGVPRRSVELEAGLRSRDKTLRVRGAPAALADQLASALAALAN